MTPMLGIMSSSGGVHSNAEILVISGGLNGS